MTNKKRLTISILCLLMLIVSMLAFSACGGKVENFNLSFKVDGENHSTISTNGSEVVTIPENPTKEGYTFDGWYWDKDVWSKPFTANSLMDAPISSDMSVYAKFSAIKYDITYENDGGTHNNPATYTIESIFEFADAQKAGYTFLGWYTDASFSTPIKAISAGTTGDTTLYAKFELATYSISYDNTKGAENTNPSTYTINSDTIAFSPLSKDGFTFAGWYVGDTKVMEISKGSTGNLTLTAKWDTIGYTITYHNVDGATNGNASTYDVEDQPLVLSDAGKNGYRFLGWYTDAAFTNKVSEIAIGTTGDINLYAKWELIEYTATFMDGNTVVETVKFTVETESITEPTVPNHVGYTGAWESYILGTENITVNAVYTLISYDITYNNASGATNNNPATYDVEDLPLVLVDASKEYYNFVGWYSDAEFTNKVTEISSGTIGDITLYANWEGASYKITTQENIEFENEVKVTFISEGTIIRVKTIKPNQALEYVTPDSRILENKLFVGWYEDEECEEPFDSNSRLYSDITLYAKWITIDPASRDFYELSCNSTIPSTNNRIYPAQTTYYFVAIQDGPITVHYKNNISGTMYGIGVSIYELDYDGGEDIPLHSESLFRSADAIFDESLDVYSSFTFEAEQGKVYYLSVYRVGSGNNYSSFSGYVIGDGVSRLTNCYIGNFLYREYGSDFELPIPIKNHYEFMGWFYIDNGVEKQLTDVEGQSFSKSKQITKDIETYSKWTPIEYTATFMDGETIVAEIPFTVETDSITAPTVPTHIGYIGSWESYTIGEEDITIDAVYTAIEYTATFMDGETIVAEIPFTVETEFITAPAVPKHTGFVGVWESYSVDSQNITINAIYTVSLFTISDATKTNIKEFDIISPELLGITAYNTLGESGTLVTTIKSGVQRAGTTITITASVTDVTGNVTTKDFEIKVYGTPKVVLNQDNLVINENTDLTSLFTAYDSFGKKLTPDITVSGEKIEGNTIIIIVKATDDFDNTATKQYAFGVQPFNKTFVELYVDGEYWQSFFADDINNYNLPVPALEDDMQAVGWTDSSGKRYTDVAGKGLLALPEHIQLHYLKYTEEYVLITTADDLKNVSANSKCILFENLDLGGMKWTPIGTQTAPFNGIFEGNGHIISNFEITSSVQYAGLFGYNTGTINNLGVENFVIDVMAPYSSSYYSYSYAGGLVGYNYQGAITNCYTTGTISSKAGYSASYGNYSYAGGLVGYNDSGTIINCYATGDVFSKYGTSTGSSSCYCCAGGLVGGNYGNITYCYATGDVSSYAISITDSCSSDAGGLVGAGSANIVNCYATGDVSSSSGHDSSSASCNSRSYAGGLIGSGSANIVNCYATGDVFSSSSSSSTSSFNDKVSYSYAGGLAGYISANMLNCYATGNVSSSSRASTRASSNYSYAGGLVGYDDSKTNANCYRYSEQVITVAATQNKLTNTVGTATSLENLQSKDWVKKHLWIDESELWDFDIGYPRLDYNVIMSKNSVKIYTKDDLLKLQGKTLVRDYTLMCDINLDGVDWNPIAFFFGSFDGNGYVISNFKVNDNILYTGLFGYNSGNISNLHVEKFSIVVTGSYDSKISTGYAGGLVGYNFKGTIKNCSAAGEVSSSINYISKYNNSHAGGLVGYNDQGKITNCHATTSATSVSGGSSYSYSHSYAGGLVGYNNEGVLTNCHATGVVNSSSSTNTNSSSDTGSSCSYAGGLVGYNNQGEIINCYASGEANSNADKGIGSSYSGGLVGYNNRGSTIECYATVNVSSSSSASYSSISNNSYAGGLIGYSNYDNITNCYSTGNVSSSSRSGTSCSFAGGLVGYNKAGTIINSYTTSQASASTFNSSNSNPTYAGGLVGYNDKGTIKNCYATGNVSSKYDFLSSSSSYYCYAGGLVGYSNNGTITNCYHYRGQTYAITKKGTISIIPTNTEGTEKNMGELQSITYHTITLEWSTHDWNFVEGTHPTLKNIGTTN